MRQSALGPLKRGLLFERFFKISLGPLFALFQKMRVLGDLPKIAITSPGFLTRQNFKCATRTARKVILVEVSTKCPGFSSV